jgi:hypothetical protein
MLLMWAERETIVVGIALLVQLMGIVGVLVARLLPQRGASGLSVAIALACMVAVGVVSLGSMEACGRCWLVFATTLPLMAVGATLDLRKTGVGQAF